MNILALIELKKKRKKKKKKNVMRKVADQGPSSWLCLPQNYALIIPCEAPRLLATVLKSVYHCHLQTLLVNVFDIIYHHLKPLDTIGHFQRPVVSTY